LPYYRNSEKDASRAYMAAVRDAVRAGDVVIATGQTYAVCAYYMRRWKIAAALLSYPLSAQDHPGYLNCLEEMARPQELEQDAQRITELLDARLGAGGSVVVLFSSPYEMNSRLLARFPPVFEPVLSPPGTYREALIGAPVRVLRFRRRA
ncbi:MAG: hypothetical protein PHU21_11440, partial [Elusimicrobia bacterium]|nr:hypothetical protein [Elusimicrobiota bacterium]